APLFNDSKRASAPKPKFARSCGKLAGERPLQGDTSAQSKLKAREALSPENFGGRRPRRRFTAPREGGRSVNPAPQKRGKCRNRISKASRQNTYKLSALAPGHASMLLSGLLRNRRLAPLSRILKDRRGGVVPMFALCIVPIIGFTGAAVDY